MPIDFLIVGQGLAGSLLAWELMQHQYRVLVVDNGEESASQVAAGLINPVTGQRLVKSMDIDMLLPSALACYRRLEKTFAQTYFVSMPMLRILRNEREYATAKRRLSQSDYQNYLQSWGPAIDGIESKFGILRQHQAGYLRTRSLLARLQDLFIANGAYRRLRFDYRDISVQPELKWQDIRPRHIVFCEGHHATANPWFGDLPFQPVKGEILACETNVICPDEILNYGHWLIPLDEYHFKTGATFDPENLDNLPTPQAESRLLAGVSRVCPRLEPFSVSEHKAGVRPATLDKQPFIGAHPRHANLHIFNGFGAKGSLAIPWHCREFVALLEGKSQLNNGSHVRRYYDSYFAN